METGAFVYNDKRPGPGGGEYLTGDVRRISALEKKDSFLESKIQTPTAPRNFLVRERLLQSLDDGEERLIIVSAGMGYGKTVLLTHYAKRHPDTCAWYHLSDTDNDIMVFARYLSKSVAKIVPEFQPDFSPYLALEQNEGLVQNLALDFAALFRALGDRRVDLVLDDFQVISNDWIFQFLNMILEQQPGGLRLFLCMKSAPPAFCARYLLEQRARVLGADSMAFNLEEVKLMIGEYTQPQNLDQVARAVQTYMEGWPAGISFAILYFRQRQSRMTEREVEQACQQSYLQDYFMHELFRKLPFELQRFLTSTAVLDYLRPDVCNALAGIDNAAGQLSYLERENLFILRISGSGHLYRYHGLFRNFLLAQLQPAQRKQLLEKASDFYLRTPDKAQAAEYALACGDGDRLQTAVEAVGPETLVQGRLDTLRRWLVGLAAAGSEPSPEILLLWGQYCERTGDWQRALELAEQVIAGYPGKTGERCMLEARLLWAQIARDRISAARSLEVLEEILPKLRPERRAMAGLFQQAAELRLQDLLNLKQYDRALEQALMGTEEALRRRDEGRVRWNREMAAVCFFVMGDYRRAIQMYVTLRSCGGGAGAAPCYHLYLAVSGRAGQALRRLNQTLEELPEGISRWELENLLLVQTLIGQLAALTEGTSDGEEAGKGFWESQAVYGSLGSREFGSLVHTLRRALREEPLSPKEEDELFALDSGEFIIIQDGARWLTVRRLVRRGETDRALELCGRTRADRAAWEEEDPGDGTGRVNAFLAFLTLEEVLLLREREPARAEELLRRCARYVTENRLVCPGLTQPERAALDELLARCGNVLPLPAEEQAPVEWTEKAAPFRVTVRAFGRLRVLLPDGQELHWRTRKAQELFAYLFHREGAPVDRERLLDILWPQSTPANATSLLHTSLYSIRKSLAPYGLEQLIAREKKSYRMDMSLVDSDRGTMDAACKGAETGTDPAALYEGPYLEDIEAAWAEDARAWYAGAFLRLCRTAAEACMQRQDYSGAAQHLRGAVGQEPYDEDLAGRLIRCYAAMGQIKNAMAVYNRLKETLSRELGAEPGEELRRIYQECLLRRLDSGRAAT